MNTWIKTQVNKQRTNQTSKNINIYLTIVYSEDKKTLSPLGVCFTEGTMSSVKNAMASSLSSENEESEKWTVDSSVIPTSCKVSPTLPCSPLQSYQHRVNDGLSQIVILRGRKRTVHFVTFSFYLLYIAASY